MFSAIISRLIILFCGILYPAYASYKAVRTKSVKEYVKWMMYWIVFAFFTFAETITDVFLSWFPFYYEIKVLLVIWLLSPVTKGSSVLYRKFVHPMLIRHEEDIEEYLNQAKEKGYSAVLQLGSKSVNYATNVIMQTAIKGGGNLVQTIKRSYSLSDLSEPDVLRTKDKVKNIDDITPAHPEKLLRQKNQVERSSSGSRHSTGMFFSEVDVNSKNLKESSYNIQSSEDISSGYCSAETMSTGLNRTSSMTTRTRLKTRRVDDCIVPAFIADNNFNENKLNSEQYVNFYNSIKYLKTGCIPETTMSLINLNDWNNSIFYENQNFRDYGGSSTDFFFNRIKPEFQYTELINKCHQLIQSLPFSTIIKDEKIRGNLKIIDDNDFDSLSDDSNENMEDFVDAKEAENGEFDKDENIDKKDDLINNRILTTENNSNKNCSIYFETPISNLDAGFKHVKEISTYNDEQNLLSNNELSNQRKCLETEDSKFRGFGHSKGKAPDPHIIKKNQIKPILNDLDNGFNSQLRNPDVKVSSNKKNFFKIWPSMFRSDINNKSLDKLAEKSSKTSYKETEI